MKRNTILAGLAGLAALIGVVLWWRKGEASEVPPDEGDAGGGAGSRPGKVSAEKKAQIKREKEAAEQQKAAALQVDKSFAQAYAKAKSLEKVVNAVRAKKQAAAGCAPGQRFVLELPSPLVLAVSVSLASEKRDGVHAENNSKAAPSEIWSAITTLENHYKKRLGADWKSKCVARASDEAG